MFKSKLIRFSSFLFVFAFTNQIFAAPQTQVFPEVQTYDELVHAIRAVRTVTQKRIDEAINQEKVREAWETGQLINAHILKNKNRAEYGTNVLLRLSGDLGTSYTELRYILRFARTYPDGPPTDPLSWSHYRELISVDDSNERESLAKEAVRKNWSAGQVRVEVRRRRLAQESQKENIFVSGLNARLGKIGLYRVIRAEVGPFAGELAVDLGFTNCFQPKEIKKFKEGDLVVLQKGKLKKTEAYDSDRYTYTAYVTQVIDGDTFKAVIDLGFDIATEQKLRLRGLDAPEIESADGREAKKFLERELSFGDGRKVLIKTVKSDKYDRYLADVWVGETYVNQKLIDEDLAVRVSE